MRDSYWAEAPSSAGEKQTKLPLPTSRQQGGVLTSCQLTG